jgi:hypothetical protein
VGLFDRLKRKPQPAPPPITWHVYREGTDLVADDGRGNTYRAALSRARGVRVVPLTGGNPHGGTGGGYQVAIAYADGDAPIGKPSNDWRAARELAQKLCDTAELPLDELTERLFSRVGTFS